MSSSGNGFREQFCDGWVIPPASCCEAERLRYLCYRSRSFCIQLQTSLLCRFPCPRRVARLSGAETACTENREKPRISPFRVLLPRPPGGGLGAGGQGVREEPAWAQNNKESPATAPQPNKAIPRPPARRAAVSWPQRLRRPQTPFSSYPPPRAAHRQARTHPVGQPRTGRQPRRQRRVARLSGTETACMENREKPRISPFRVLLPWPPGGGLGAGGQGGARCKPALAQNNKESPATAPQHAAAKANRKAAAVFRYRCRLEKHHSNLSVFGVYFLVAAPLNARL